MTKKIENVTLFKVAHVIHVTSENQTCNTFKIKHVKHVTQKIKHVTLLKLNM